MWHKWKTAMGGIGRAHQKERGHMGHLADNSKMGLKDGAGLL
jgi:hypothetical protein